MLTFHGTTSKGLQAILNSDGYKPSAPWTCSDNDNSMYLWPSNKIASMEGYCENDDLDDIISRGIQQGFESAQIQAITSEDFELYVLMLEIDESILQDDFSCDNMSEIASFIDCDQFSGSMVKKVFHFKMNKWFAPILASQLLRNEYFNKWALSPELLTLAENLQNSEIYLDELYQFDYKSIELPSL